MSATRRKIDLDLDVEHTGPAPLARRESDHKFPHRFFRFDPTVSSGTLLQLASIAVGFAIAYGTYQSDRTQTRADIVQLQVSAARDRSDVQLGAERLSTDVKEMKADIKEMSVKLITIQAQTSLQGARK